MRTQGAAPKMRGSARHGGFSLIELMITVGIAAILATIAAAVYTSEVQKSRRTDARTALLDLAGREEKLYSVSNAYSAVASDLGYAAAGVPWPVTIGSGYYNVSVVAPAGASTYTITATAIGLQANDTQCVKLTLDQLGTQSSTGTATPATCWGN